MDEKKYTASEVKPMLEKSMNTFRSSMIGLIRDCAIHPRYKSMTGEDALKAVADKLEALK